MSEKKYLVNKGFETAERQMLQAMSEYAENGWILSAMTPARFEFVKAEPQSLQYAMEYKPALSNRKEYLETVERSGWAYVCEREGFRIFCAPVGTPKWDIDHNHMNLRIKLRKRMWRYMMFTGILFLALDIMSGSYMSILWKLIGAVGCAILIGYSAAGLIGLREKKEE